LTSYLALLTLVVSSVVFYSAKTEQSRVVTIQKPLVITQERKTPAYFVYQQAQALKQKVETPKNTKTTFLSNLSVQPVTPKLKLSEITFSKKEYARLQQKFNVPNREIANYVGEDLANSVYEKVVFDADLNIPGLEQEEVITHLSPSRKWATIRGKLELRDGVGIVDHKIDLRRVEEGSVREIGKIDLKAGSYNIDIESPNGYLIAQIRDRNGLIIGEDSQRLVNLQNKGSYFEGPFMRIGRPDSLAANPATSNQGNRYTKSTTQATTTAASSFATFKQTPDSASSLSASIFDNQKTLAQPTDEFTNISRYSSSITRLTDPSRIYADITTIRMTGDKTETAMFTQKWVDGVVSYVSDLQQMQLKSKNLPVLIGKVLVDGKPVAGAQVDIENLPSVHAIYFDQFMIPSLNQGETSANGYFMFIGLEPDAYEVVASKSGFPIGSQLFVAEETRVAFQNIQTLAVPKAKVIRTFDAFTAEVLQTDVIVADQAEAFQTAETGSYGIKTKVQDNVSDYIARHNDPLYVPIRYVQSGARDYAHIPMIQEHWLTEIMRLRQINELPNTGIVIGFTSGLKYDAYLSADNYPKNNTIYFNEYGQPSLEPVVGGGFILFNVPVGAREVVLQDQASDRIYSQVFHIRANQVSASHFTD
jgi:hypothetical protein